jgi:hypothetical protein
MQEAAASLTGDPSLPVGEALFRPSMRSTSILCLTVKLPETIWHLDLEEQGKVGGWAGGWLAGWVGGWVANVTLYMCCKVICKLPALSLPKFRPPTPGLLPNRSLPTLPMPLPLSLAPPSALPPRFCRPRAA